MQLSCRGLNRIAGADGSESVIVAEGLYYFDQMQRCFL